MSPLKEVIMKRALTVGIDYPGTAHALRGCVNDSHTICNMLKTKFGFVDSDITQLLNEEATTRRIKQELLNLIDGSRAGDVLFFHFSGHGTQVIDNMDDDHEPDGLDEIICPVDFDWRDNVITDDDMKEIFDRVPPGVNLTVFLDCCHSGGGVDSIYEHKVDPGKSNLDEPGRFLPPPRALAKKIKMLQLEPKNRMLARNFDSTGMLISGSQSHQTAADAFIAGKYQGATTYYLQKALEDLTNPTYVNIIEHLNNSMATHGFSQRPQLDGPTSLHHREFLSSYDFGNPDKVANVEGISVEPSVLPDPEEIVVPDKPTNVVNIDTSTTVNLGNEQPAPAVSEKKEKEDDKRWMIYAGVAVVAIVIIGLITGT